MTKCPCSSGKSYTQCCEPIINSQSAPTALALMRSRYTAYCLGMAEYISQSTHSKTRKQHKLSDIEKWAKESTWQKLEVISIEHGKINDTKGIVEFKAYFRDKNGKDQIHHERSTFQKNNNQWFFLDGVIDPKEVDLTKKVSRNDPCPCGSGKKHKKCCGAS